MEQAWRSGHVRIVTVSAVVLAAAAMAIVLGSRTAPGSACGCAADPSCSWMTDGPGPPRAPFFGRRPAPHGRHAGDRDHVPRHAFSIPLDGDGFVFKVSLYRGLGGGVASSFTRDGIAFTFEGGGGVGGSFSVGSAVGRPDAGLAFEARASMSGRLHVLRPPDFGLTLSRNGVMRGYMDAKTGNFRTRFRSRPVSLTGGRVEAHSAAPVTRRSWSLGTEFKVAAGYTVTVPWGGLLSLWTGVFGTVPGRAPPARPPELLGYLGVSNRAVVRPSKGVDLRRVRAQALLAGPGAGHGRAVSAGDRRTRIRRPRALATPPRTGPRKGPSTAAPEGRDPAGGRRVASSGPDIEPGDLEIRHYCRSAN
ncbi:hypothetical protein [Actinomadura geliboluensis]|uniref:hypothetical protein n=1 Tax=Actinomadura geliboluensis TaxID=882440 RepID=UPI0036CCFC09